MASSSLKCRVLFSTPLLQLLSIVTIIIVLQAGLLAEGKRRIRIRAGTVVKSANTYPYLVMLDSSERQCTGSLIAPDLVLTAGHCVCKDASLQWAYFNLLNRWNTAIEEKEIEITQYAIPPGYEEACAAKGSNSSIFNVQAHDLAICNLAEDALIKQPGAALISMNLDSMPEIGSLIQVIGYGMDEMPSSYGILRNGTLTLNDCPKQLEGALCVDHREGANVNHPGAGDSGGPIILSSTGQVVGVVSGTRSFEFDNGQLVDIRLEKYNESNLVQFEVFANTYTHAEFIKIFL